MSFENDLNFFCEILEKCHINTAVLSAFDSLADTLNPILGSLADYFFATDASVQSVFGNIESKTKYLFSNELMLQYVCLRLPILSEKNILLIGPYLSALPDVKEILEMGERVKLNPLEPKLLQEFYNTLPIVPQGDRLFSLINAFCERIWQTTSFSIVEFNKQYPLPIIPIERTSHDESGAEILAKTEMMEKRYAFENELMRAVSLGQQHKESLLAAAFKEDMFESRVQDPVRNAKNYSIIMNTLLRKASEEGGVHPIHIDRLSSSFAAKIEQAPSLQETLELMKEMFSSYCRLVHKHSVGRYSPIVKKTVIIIDSDISAELSLSTLAKQQSISEGHLATVFKKETGKTLSEFVRDKRMEYAKYLLSTTNLQIQTVAQYCGIMDVQYFSKIFKKQIGKTPREYRESVKS